MNTEELSFKNPEQRRYKKDDRVYVRNDTRWLMAKIVEHVDPTRYAVRITETTVFSTENIKPRGEYMNKDLRMNFVPRADITTYELAIIVRNVLKADWAHIVFKKETWDALPKTLTRHFVEDIKS